MTRRLLGAVPLLWLAAVSLHAQLASSVLTGEVRDSTGGVVTDATVTARDQATGFLQVATSGTAGVYRLGSLRPGLYNVTVEKAGFRPLISRDLTLVDGQIGRLDVTLEPGIARQSIEVTGEVSALQADDASVGYRTEYESVVSLPLVDRNVIGLSALGPGVPPRHLGGFVADGITDVQRARGAVELNFPVHGARTTSNRTLIDGAIDSDFNVFATAVIAPLESVQEFRTVTSLAPAEYPQAGGGVVTITTKSGARNFHGNAFEYFRNEVTDARNYFDSPGLPRPIFRNHQFGGTLSGPLPFSHTFFFATYEGVRGKSASSSLNIVPDAQLRSGDFSQAEPIFDPVSLNAQGRRLPFEGNRIPEDRISPVARRFLERFQPLPNTSGAGGNYLDATPGDRRLDSTDARVDHQLQGGSRMFARYTLNSERSLIAGLFPLLPTDQSVRAQQAVVGHTAAGSFWVSETRISFTRLRIFALPQSAFRTNVAQDLGMNDAPEDPFTWGLPFFLVTNFNLRTDDPALPQTQRDNLWQLSSSLAKSVGRHTWKVGFQWLGFHMNYRQSIRSRGRLTFTGAFTGQPGVEGTGDPFADFLLGFPQITERNVGAVQSDLLRSSWSGFIQDEWRIHSRITLSLGLRLEYTAPFREERGRLLNLDYSTLPSAPRLGSVERGVNPDRNDLSPRVGVAARLPRLPGFGKIAFRAGYGVYYDPAIAIESYDLVRNALRNEINQTDGSRPLLTLTDPFPQDASTGLPGYFGIDRDARTPYVQQWNAGFQHELTGNGVIEVAYTGTKGTKLPRFRQFNTPLRVLTGENFAPRPGDLPDLRPFPKLGVIVQRQHISNSVYHGLEIRVEKRFTQGLYLLSSFVWAKSIDDADSSIPGNFQSFGAQDERNLRLERGLSVNNVGRRLNGNVVYRLPVPTDASFLFRGWELSGTAVLQDGMPLNPVYFAFDAANSGTPNRPNVVPGQPLTLPRGDRSVERFFNTEAFSSPEPFTFGNAGRNILSGPGNVVFNAAVMRRFQIQESAAITFRAESFNLTNHPNWGIPGPYPDFGPFFGRIFASGEPRRFQFALRLDF